VDLGADVPIRRCAAAAVKNTPYCPKHQNHAAGFAKLERCLRPGWERIAGATEEPRVRNGRPELADSLGDLERENSKAPGAPPRPRGLGAVPTLAERVAALKR
jgi:hypothetical protein